MKNKYCLLHVVVLVIIGLTGNSCSIGGRNYSPVTPTSFAMEINVTPSITPSPTLLPAFGPLEYPTSFPYPTAIAINARAVAFIEKDIENNSSLWIANTDGSGERILVDNIGKWSSTINFFLRWSPSREWISYISNDELWVISPDGLDKRKIISVPDDNKRLISYNWNPDGLQVAYAQISLQETKFYSETVSVLNLGTGETYELSSSDKPQPYGTVLRWSPNGQYLVFNRGDSFIVLDAASRKVKKEILTDTECSSADNTGPHWSPTSEWFFHEHSASAHYTFSYICISGLDGSTHRVEMDGTIYSDVVWGKTGDFLYFVTRNIDQHGDPNLDADLWLQRYDIRTQKLERFLSLGQRYRSAWSVSISPDGRILETHTQISENQQSYVLMDLVYPSIKKFTLEFGCTWLDSKNFVCSSESDGRVVFYKRNIHTGQTTAFSGEHIVVSWVISPMATSP